jgi:hypothetical protein
LKRSTAWDRLKDKQDKEVDIKRSLFKAPDYLAIEMQELEESAMLWIVPLL